MEMFSMRTGNKNKYTFIATTVFETAEGKRIFKALNSK